MAVPEELHRLVERFDENRDAYHSGGYNEAQVRVDFINPLLEVLGWDVDNRQGKPEAYRDVIYEDRAMVGGGTKAPDYGLYTGGERRLFLEAKKPSVDIAGDVNPAVQLRRYAWSAKLPLSLLSDFEELAIYDCRFEPDKGDTPAAARLDFFTFEEYVERWDDLYSLFSREAVLDGSLKKYAEETKRKRGTETVDASFLREIEDWRSTLARDFTAGNDLNSRQLNYAVQMTIDRIIFLRMAEDRGIEDYGRMLGITNGGGVYGRLRELFRDADDRYNSGLFHFRSERSRDEEPDLLTPSLELSDDVLRGIIRGLYYPESPYEFRVLPVEALGQVYEQFLGSVISLEDGHRATIEEKPEVRKAGGVYYTPTYIVRYIVENTVGKLLEGKRPGPRGGASRLKIVDPACGSGSFLIGAYEYLLDWHRDLYLEDGPEKHSARLYQGAGDQWHLTIDEKKRILTNNIFGVDIDPQAVEVTKLSLLLKVLEGESELSITRQLFHGRALPDLDENIKCGNSLIGSDFYDNEQMSFLHEEEHYRINVFDWEDSFPRIFQGDNPGFDAVIGNPPWLVAGYYANNDLGYLRNCFESATGKFDMYYAFIEQGCRLLSTEGLFGMIVPNKFFHTGAASHLRVLLAEPRWVRRIVDFGSEQMFSTATNYSCLLFLQKKPGPNPTYIEASIGLATLREFKVPWSVLDSDTWHFEDQRTRELFKKVEEVGEPLEHLAARFGTGVQSGADRLLMVDRDTANSLSLEGELLHPILRGRDIRRYVLSEESKLLVFPYKVEGNEYKILEEKELEECEATYNLLQENRKKLSKRVWFGKVPEELSGKWYGMVYLDSYCSFAVPHILTPSLSNRSNFMLGRGDLFATGTAGVTSFIPKESVPEDIAYLLGLLDSSLISFYATRHSPVFSGGYYKFSAPYLRKLPIRTIDFSDAEDAARHERMVGLVERMLSLHEQLAEAKIERERTVIGHQISTTDRQIDRLVYELYGLTQDEINIVEEATAGSEGFENKKDRTE